MNRAEGSSLLGSSGCTGSGQVGCKGKTHFTIELGALMPPIRIFVVYEGAQHVRLVLLIYVPVPLRGIETFLFTFRN
jgi:hypothetical protein